MQPNNQMTDRFLTPPSTPPYHNSQQYIQPPPHLPHILKRTFSLADLKAYKLDEQKTNNQ
ncbi:protein of unknown function [Pseudomonas mediterranea]